MIYKLIPTFNCFQFSVQNLKRINSPSYTLNRIYSSFTQKIAQDSSSEKFDFTNNLICDKDIETKLELTFNKVTHLQPHETWLQTLPFLLKIQNAKDFKTVPKTSQVWYTKDDPRILGIKPFLPTKFDDAKFLQLEAVWVYRKLLRESLRFFDLRAREYLINRIKLEYRHYQGSEFQKQIPELRSQARKFSRLIARANQYDREAIDKILGYTYARCYKLRWELLKIPLHPMIVTLVKFHDLKTKPACSKHVEHSPVRLFNHYRQHTNRILGKIQPPLPQYLFQELETKSDIQYHFSNFSRYPLDPRPTPKITIPAKDFFKMSELSSASPDPTKLRRIARCYQRLLLNIPLQTSGPDFFNPETVIRNGKICFSHSKWAGRRPKPYVSELDLCPIGDGVIFLNQV